MKDYIWPLILIAAVIAILGVRIAARSKKIRTWRFTLGTSCLLFGLGSLAVLVIDVFVAARTGR